MDEKKLAEQVGTIIGLAAVTILVVFGLVKLALALF